MNGAPDRGNWVGPVLQVGSIADAVVQALTQANPELKIVDRGAYLRVLAPDRCTLERKRVEALLGRSFALPADLERIMPSFSGSLHFDADRAVWQAYRSAE